MNRDHIYLGDCFKVLPTFENDSVDYTLTSPPYNIGISIGQQGQPIYTEYSDNLDQEAYFNFLSKVIDELLRITKKQVFFNVQYASANKTAVFSIIGKYAKNMKDLLIWNKTPVQPARHNRVLSHNYEFFFVLAKNAEKRSYEVDFGKQGKHTTCFTEMSNACVNRERFGCDGNFAIMSIQAARRIITSFTKEGELVLDPFMGSGTTAIACKEINRNYIGIEISEKYKEIAEERIEKADRTYKLL